MPPIDFYQSLRSTSTPSDVRNLGIGAGQPPFAEQPDPADEPFRERHAGAEQAESHAPGVVMEAMLQTTTDTTTARRVGFTPVHVASDTSCRRLLSAPPGTVAGPTVCGSAPPHWGNSWPARRALRAVVRV